MACWMAAGVPGSASDRRTRNPATMRFQCRAPAVERIIVEVAAVEMRDVERVINNVDVFRSAMMESLKRGPAVVVYRHDPLRSATKAARPVRL